MVNEEPPEDQEDRLEDLLKRIGEQTEGLEETLKKHSLQAPKIVAAIIKDCQNGKLANEYFEKPVQMLAEYMKDASIYKRRRLGLRISKLDIVPRILICRALLALGVENFPLDLCMSNIEWNPRVASEEVMRYQRPKDSIAMAFGDNTCGKLGIGSDVDRVDVLTPVILPGKIVNIFMSECHSIFVLKNGDIYGAGRAANFLEGAQDSEENILTPVKIPFSRPDPHKHTPKIVVTNKSTSIVDYTYQSYLVFGDVIPWPQKTVIAEGPNWKILQTEVTFCATVERDMANKEVFVDAHDGTRRWVTVKEDGSWLPGDDVKNDIAFLVDGFRVNSEKFWKKYRVTKDGDILGVADGNFYKGRLKTAPRGVKNGEDDDTDEDGTDGDVQVLTKADDVLLAVMEEVAVPMAFDDIQCTFNGNAYILYNGSHTENVRFSDKLSRFRPYMIYDESELNVEFETDAEAYGPLSLTKFNRLREAMKVKMIPEWFGSWGLPIISKNIRVLLILEHFLRIDGKTGLTKVFVENIKDDNSLDRLGILKEMDTSFRRSTRIPMLVVKAGWTSGECSERIREVRKKARDFVLDLLDRVEGLFKKMNNVPMKYRVNRMDFKFGEFVAYILEDDPLRIDEYDQDKDVKACDHTPDGVFNRNHCHTAMQQRITCSDLDGEEQRWKLVRVEALPLEHALLEELLYQRFNIHTTRFHIQCIDPELLKQIDENQVLNLNNVCLYDASPTRYIEYLDSFFLVNDSENHLRLFQRKIDVISVAESLPANEKYTVKTSDGQTLQVPKVLFEVFSAFDAGRKRASSVTGEGLDTFEVSQCTAETLKLLLACLIDIRVFYRASMDLKIQVYQAAQYYLFEHLHTEMLRMIVETAQEQDHAHIADLVDKCLDGTFLELIAIHRPDILIFWKNIPINNNYLEVLTKISKIIVDYRFKKVAHIVDPQSLPIIASVDMNVDKEKISHKYMKKLISNHEQDEDVNIELVKTLLAWDPDNPQDRKRPWPFGPIPIWPH